MARCESRRAQSRRSDTTRMPWGDAPDARSKSNGLSAAPEGRSMRSGCAAASRVPRRWAHWTRSPCCCPYRAALCACAPSSPSAAAAVGVLHTAPGLRYAVGGVSRSRPRSRSRSAPAWPAARTGVAHSSSHAITGGGGRYEAKPGGKAAPVPRSKGGDIDRGGVSPPIAAAHRAASPPAATPAESPNPGGSSVGGSSAGGRAGAMISLLRTGEAPAGKQ